MTPKHVYLCICIASLLKCGTSQLTTEDTNTAMNTTSAAKAPATKPTAARAISTTPSAATTTSTTPSANCNITVNRSACRLDNTPRTRTSTVSIIDRGSMSKEVYNAFDRWSVYIQLPLVVLGIFTNIFNITVFTRKRMRSATSTILTFLSASELGVALAELIMASTTASLGRRTYTSKIFWILFRWSRVYLTIVFQRWSFCFNIFVAAERFIAVRFPLKAKAILQHVNPVAFCATICVIITGINIFNPLKMEVFEIRTGRGVIHTIRNSQLYTNNPDAFDILSLVTKILFSYIPLFGCLLLNVLMVTALWNHRRKKKSMQTHQEAQQQNERRQIQTTITILVSTFLFAFLSLPVTTTSIIQSTNPEFGERKREHYLFRFLVQFNGLLYLMSLSMDFLVYMILSRAFRQTFINLSRSVFRRRPQTGIPRNQTSGTRSTALSHIVTQGMEKSMSMSRSTTNDDVTKAKDVQSDLSGSTNLTGDSGMTMETEGF